MLSIRCMIVGVWLELWVWGEVGWGRVMVILCCVWLGCVWWCLGVCGWW